MIDTFFDRAVPKNKKKVYFQDVIIIAFIRKAYSGRKCQRTQPGVRAARRGPGAGQGATGAGGVRGVGHDRLRGVRIVRRGGRRR